jgi:hypothetical protein
MAVNFALLDAMDTSVYLKPGAYFGANGRTFRAVPVRLFTGQAGKLDYARQCDLCHLRYKEGQEDDNALCSYLDCRAPFRRDNEAVVFIKQEAENDC